MKKKMMHCALFVFLLATSLTGCSIRSSGNPSSRESDGLNPGIEESGSMEDYAGWWQLEAANKTVPFTCIEIPKDHVDEVRCYDKTGDRIDAGYADYNEQRARNGNPLIVFTFDGIGEFGANASGSADGTRWLELSYHGQWFSFYYQETPKF